MNAGMKTSTWTSCAMGALAMLSQTVAAADSTPRTGCAAFTWEVSRELAVMQQGVKTVVAARTPAAPVRIQIEERYSLRLSPQKDVTFAANPGKPRLQDGAHAGMASFRVPTHGRYRVSITSRHWIDVVDGGTVIVSKDFQGQRGCEWIHKIVEFELPADRDLTLQLSGDTAEQVEVAVTEVKRTR